MPQKTDIFLEIFQILPLRTAASICFFVWPIEINVPSIVTKMHRNEEIFIVFMIVLITFLAHMS